MFIAVIKECRCSYSIGICIATVTIVTSAVTSAVTSESVAVPPDPSLPPVLKVNCSASEDVCWTTPYSSIVNNLSDVISTSEELSS